MSKQFKIKAPQAKRLRSMDLSQGAVFKQKAASNPYIRGKRYQARPAAQTRGTNAEIY